MNLWSLSGQPTMKLSRVSCEREIFPDEVWPDHWTDPWQANPFKWRRTPNLLSTHTYTWLPGSTLSIGRNLHVHNLKGLDWVVETQPWVHKNIKSCLKDIMLSGAHCSYAFWIKPKWIKAPCKSFDVPARCLDHTAWAPWLWRFWKMQGAVRLC